MKQSTNNYQRGNRTRHEPAIGIELNGLIAIVANDLQLVVDKSCAGASNVSVSPCKVAGTEKRTPVADIGSSK